ncbi:hypothetical protein [Shewanella litorisediminis]|uniref:Uncharacterized protein n=1 Tax=Shewanella litorisediminis TaxID=1173586 RepID=A0ABX7G7U5_9GAMM|nr:hypothetical protein [Shewanella litorisediminis]MCL2919714.1 hypothetical protein [Shewanella litorisediminis]QRH03339.1 hypothetical protein JQC75_08140 [Shewanella litorisediminis]
MKVSPPEYKVIGLKAYFLTLSIIGILYLLAMLFMPEQKAFWTAMTKILWLVIFIFCTWSAINGKKSIATKQYPAPGTYVLSTWEVCKGDKAVTLGKYLYWLGSVMSVLSFIVVCYLIFVSG